MTSGVGGMLITDRDDLHERVLVLRDHGRPPRDKSFVNGEVAFKYKMSSLQAAFGTAQLERLDELVARKRAIFGWYREELAGAAGITLNFEPADVANSFWMVTAIVEGPAADKTRLIAQMSERGIDCRPIFSPLSSQPAFAGHPSAAGARERNPVSYALGRSGINLPSGLGLDRETVGFVARTFRAIVEGAGAA
jgi:perosamine synthetase